jgi:matrix metalloproteinase-14 (membrane-inserted)
VDHGFPKQLAESFPGIPSPVDAAMVFSVDKNIYFFREDKYWKFDPKLTPPVSSAYPKHISDWKGIPNNIDAASSLKDTYGNEFTYFFKGNQFWRFNDKSFSVSTHLL